MEYFKYFYHYSATKENWIGLILMPILLGLVEFILVLMLFPVLDETIFNKISFMKHINGTFVIICVITSLFLRLIISKKINSSLNKVRHDISAKNLKFLIKSRSEYVRSYNKGELLALLMSEVDNFITYIMMQSTFTLSYLFSIISLLIMSLYVNLEKTFIVLIMLVSVASIIIIPMILVLALYGKKRLIENEKRFKAAAEILDNQEIIRIYNVSEKFSERFISPSKLFNKYLTNIMTITLFPRIFIETAIFSIYLVFIFYGIQISSFSTSENIILISVLIKVLPNIQNTINAISKLSLGKDSIKTLESMTSIKAHKQLNTLALSNVELLTISPISYSYNTNSLEYNEIKIEIGKLNYLVGKSGSGKSTLLKILLGQLISDPVKIKLDNQETVFNPLVDILSENLGYVPQDPQTLYDTIYNNVAFERDIAENSDDKVLNAIRNSGFDKNEMAMIENNLHNVLGKEFNLSGGQKQRLMLARALINNPDFLFLDEPLSAVDKVSAIKILNSIKNYISKKRCTVIFITHDHSIISPNDNVVEI